MQLWHFKYYWFSRWHFVVKVRKTFIAIFLHLCQRFFFAAIFLLRWREIWDISSHWKITNFVILNREKNAQSVWKFCNLRHNLGQFRVHFGLVLGLFPIYFCYEEYFLLKMIHFVSFLGPSSKVFAQKVQFPWKKMV